MGNGLTITKNDEGVVVHTTDKTISIPGTNPVIIFAATPVTIQSDTGANDKPATEPVIMITPAVLTNQE